MFFRDVEDSEDEAESIETHGPRRDKRQPHSHRGAVLRLLLGMEGFEKKPRYTLFAVLLFYAALVAACYYGFELLGIIYEKSFADVIYSGATRRFIGVWFTALFTFAASLLYLVGTFISLRCCRR